MAFPFSLRCDCCDRCRPCPCAAGTSPTSLQAMFDDWGAYPAGYCASCDDVNGTFELPAVAEFTPQAPLGDTYDFLAAHPPCETSGGVAGDGCLYEAVWELPCLPQACLACSAGCGASCTADADCEPAACGEWWSCGPTSPLCAGYGGSCVVDCEQETVCVFDEEMDPEHEFGVCAGVGDCTSLAAPESCEPITLRLRAMLYVDEDRRPVLSVQVILTCRTSTGEGTAVQLGGTHRFAEGTLDCAAIDVEVPLATPPDYVQPLVPACAPPTSVRIVNL